MNMYSRSGVIVPMLGKTTITMEEKDVSGTSLMEIESSGNPSLGWTGAFGVTFDAGSALKIFAEVEGINLAIKGKSDELVSISGPGAPPLALIPEGDRIINYVDEVTEASNNEDGPNYDNTKASEELARKASFSSFGFNVGVILTFGK